METTTTMIECPKCGSARQEQQTKMFFFLFLLGGGSLLIWLGLIIWPVLILGIAMAVMSPLAFLFPKMYKCLDCTNVWKEAPDDTKWYT